jgi:hypothetical protein
MVTEAITQFVMFVAVTVFLTWIALTKDEIVPYFLAGFGWLIVALTNFLLAPTVIVGYTSLFFVLLGMVFLYQGVRTVFETESLKRRGG